jgi:hypothetical protein
MILKPVFEYADPDHPNGARANRNTGDISVSANAGVAAVADLRAGVGGSITVTPDIESIAVAATGLLVAFDCSARSYIFGYAEAAAHVKMVLWQDGTDVAQTPYNQDVTLYDAHYFEQTGDRTKTVDLSVVTGNLPNRHADQLWWVAVYVTAHAIAGGASGADASCSTTVSEIRFGLF